MKKLKKNNIVNFPSSLSEGEKEVEAILFAAAEPLDIDTIESKLPKKINVLNINDLSNIELKKKIKFKQSNYKNYLYKYCSFKNNKNPNYKIINKLISSF